MGAKVLVLFETISLFRETVIAEPGNVVQHLVYGVVAFVPGSMPRPAVGGDIQYHQPFFGNGGLHLRGFAHNGELYGRQLRQYGLYPALARYFFLAGSKENQVVRLCGAAKLQEHLQRPTTLAPASLLPRP